MASVDIKVLVIDDSAFMRNALSRMIDDAPGMQVVGKGRNGKEAIDLTRSLKPDLLTLDIEMPEMDGLTALRLIRQFSKIPILMVSSLTAEGSTASLSAMRHGASDVLAKDHSMVSSNIHTIRDDLLAKIQALVEAKREVSKLPASGSLAATSSLIKQLPMMSEHALIVIGASTGAPPELERLAKAFPSDLSAPVVIAQHMPAMFTTTLATRLDKISSRPCVEAKHGMPLEPNMIVVAPGGMHTRVASQGGSLITRVSDRPQDLIYKPSVDELFDSAAQVTGKQTLGIVLTGMGADGSKGAQAIHATGGRLITQEAKSCVVYGMPKAVEEAGCNSVSMTPAQIASYLAA